MKRFYLLLFLLFINTFGFAQNKQGFSYLSGNIVNSIAIEGDYIWAGTNCGMVRINSLTNETVFYDRSNMDWNVTECFNLVIDHKGLKWFTSEYSLYSFDGIKLTRYLDPQSLVKSINVDTVGNVWIYSEDNGLSKFDGKNWVICKKPDLNISISDILRIMPDKNGKVWMICANKLISIAGDEWKIHNTPYSNETNQIISCMSVSSLGTIWVGTNKGELLEYDGKNWVQRIAPNSEFLIMNISFDSEGRVWMSTGNGFVCYENNRWTCFSLQNPIIYDSNWARPLCYNTLAIDTQNCLWLGTIQDGLIKFDYSKLQNSIALNTSFNSEITCVNIDNNSVSSFGTQNDGLAYFNGKKWTMFNSSNSALPDNHITALASQKNKTLWIGTESKGLVSYNNNVWKIYNKKNTGIPSDTIYCIAIDSKGFIWFGSPAGLSFFNGITVKTFDKSNSPLSYTDIQFIKIDQNDIVWIGSFFEDLFRFDGKSWENYKSPNFTSPNNQIQGFTLDSKNNLLVCTNIGLSVLDRNKNHSYPLFNRGERISFSYSGNPFTDSLNNLWMEMSRGYIQFIYSDSSITSINDFKKSTAVVNRVKTDSNGNKLITVDGLGYSLLPYEKDIWSVYNTSPSNLPSNKIEWIYIDSLNNKWISSNNNLIKFDGKTWFPVKNNYTNIYYSSNCQAKTIFENNWIYDIPDSLIINKELAEPPYNKSQNRVIVNFLNTDSHGIKWAYILGKQYDEYDTSTLSPGLVKIDGAKWTKYNTANSILPHERITCIAIDKHDIVWVGTYAGLIRIENDQWTLFTSFNSGLIGNQIVALDFDSKGNLWAAASPGVSMFDGKKWKSYRDPLSSIPHNNITCIAIGKNDAVWIGSYHGLAEFDQNSWKIYDKANSILPDNFIKTIAVDIYDQKWIGNYKGITVLN